MRDPDLAFAATGQHYPGSSSFKSMKELVIILSMTFPGVGGKSWRVN